MESGFRTPLLELFRRGEVPRDIRLLAASGSLAPRAHEQLALLMLLVSDEDETVAKEAESTLAAIPEERLAAFIARSDVPPEMRRFFADRGVQPAAVASGQADAPILERAGQEADGLHDPETASADSQEPPAAAGTVLQKIAALNVAQRIALAMKGTREERAVLIRDPNKIVAASVLSSPKLTETEVETIARMANVSEDVLRTIASTRSWVKNYTVALALAKNPKTPVALSMNLLSRLNEKDLRTLSTDRNVPDVLRITARKKIVINK